VDSSISSSTISLDVRLGDQHSKSISLLRECSHLPDNAARNARNEPYLQRLKANWTTWAVYEKILATDKPAQQWQTKKSDDS